MLLMKGALLMDISRRDLFKQTLGRKSLQLLSSLAPGGLGRFLGINDFGSRGSAEEAGLALGKRSRNRPPKLASNASPAKADESKAAASEDSSRDKGGDAQLS
jgi:hypothetical protein